jgi:hypothetical protein
MSRQLQLSKQELSVSQILRIYGKQYTQITERYSDNQNGRCAIGVIMSYFGWDGRVDIGTANDFLAASHALKHAGIEEDLLIEMNESGLTFDEIADNLDKVGSSNEIWFDEFD